MFEDIEPYDLQFASDDTDRALLGKIWRRVEGGDYADSEGWELLCDRYPDEPRFLLFALFAALSGRQAQRTWQGGQFLDRFEALLNLAADRHQEALGDLLAVAARRLGRLPAPDAARLQQLHARVPGGVVDPAAARVRLERLIERSLEALDERTDGHRPIAARSAAPRAPSDWKAAVAAAAGPARPYSANMRVAVGDLVEHAKFGLGVVTALEHQRAQVLFAGGPRKLVCA